MINFNALKYAIPILNNSNLLVTDLINPAFHNAITTQYPDFIYSTFSNEVGEYATNKLTFKFESSKSISNNNLLNIPFSQIWSKFLRTITAREYIRQLSDTVKINLKNKKWVIEFSRYQPGHWLDAHFDQQSQKVLTQLFYFNQVWDTGWGGYLHILDPQEICSTVLAIPPMINYSVIIKPKNDAWHRVEIIKPHVRSARLTMVLQFYEK